MQGTDYVALYNWTTPRRVTQLQIEVLSFGPSEAGQLHVRGVSLIDERDGSNVPLILSNEGHFRQVHSGDVKVYEAMDVLPRAYAVGRTRVIEDDEAALAAMADPAFDPAQTAILARGREIDEPSSGNAASAVSLISYAPEEVILQASLSAPSYVVLSDSWYPGWRATIDSMPAATERANLAFRAVYVPQGTHTVCWVYRPASYLVGLGISSAALLTIVAMLATTFARHRRRTSVPCLPTLPVSARGN